MLSAGVIVLTALAYVGLLFAIAWWADRAADAGRSLIARPTVYALSLAVYCTTWTYYGSVGRAAASGIGFLPIYLGPTLLFALGFTVIEKIIRVAQANRITSIADFIASRHGKSRLLGGLVTVIAVIGIVPYIALQLKAVAATWALLSGDGALSSKAWFSDSAFFVACILALFAIFFGARHLDATERHEGMVAAIAFESVVKLAAFTLVGVFVTFSLFNGVSEIFARAREHTELTRLLSTADSAGSYGAWFALTLLSLLSALLLPRQFQVMVVENVNPDHLRRAIWLFPLYLFLINLFVLPIALGGRLLFGLGADADIFVLTLPLAHGNAMLALFVFLGGLSAATGMVIVETVALSTMICNDLIMPLLLSRLAARRDLAGLLLPIRRIAIIVIVFLGYLYYRAAGEAYALVSIGLISFAAVAQFAPVLLGGLYWRGGTRHGALAGLSLGFLVWAYTLLLPSFARSGWLPSGFMSDGLFGIGLLRAQALFGLAGLDQISHCLLWSLLLNVAAYVGVSLWRAPDALEARQAALFVDVSGQGRAAWRGGATLADLMPLVARFLGKMRAEEAFGRYARQRRVKSLTELPADADLAHFAERLLAGAIGSASARVMVASVVEEAPPGIDEVLNILDEASQIRRYSRELEQKSRALEAASAELRAANARLTEIDRLKDDFISSVSHELRTPLTSIRAFAELLRDNADASLAERDKFLGIITAESERLTRLINQILDLAKLESGRVEWRNEMLDLSEILRAALDTFVQSAKDKAVALTLDLPQFAVPVNADRDRLMQVAVNLLANALKFVAAGSGAIHLCLSEEAGQARVEVADNGPGVCTAEREIIFEKFRQAGDTLTEKPQGTGLGLPICRQIIEAYGGKIWCEDAQESAQKTGARFVFTLPMTAKIEADSADGQQRQGAGLLHNPAPFA